MQRVSGGGMRVRQFFNRTSLYTHASYCIHLITLYIGWSPLVQGAIYNTIARKRMRLLVHVMHATIPQDI